MEVYFQGGRGNRKTITKTQTGASLDSLKTQQKADKISIFSLADRFLPTLLSEMRNCRFCKSDLQPFFANTPKRNAQL